MPAPLRALLRGLHLLESGLLVGLLGAMVVLAVVQIALRNLFDTGLDFADTLLRLMVLWGTLVGAMVAARADTHIRIDVLTRYLGGAWLAVVRRVAALFTAVVCGLVAEACYRFVLDEMEYGDVLFGDVPSWVGVSILPVAFGVLALRYALHTIWLPPLLAPAPELAAERRLPDDDDLPEGPDDGADDQRGGQP